VFADAGGQDRHVELADHSRQGPDFGHDAVGEEFERGAHTPIARFLPGGQVRAFGAGIEPSIGRRSSPRARKEQVRRPSASSCLGLDPPLCQRATRASAESSFLLDAIEAACAASALIGRSRTGR